MSAKASDFLRRVILPFPTGFVLTTRGLLSEQICPDFGSSADASAIIATIPHIAIMFLILAEMRPILDA